jgi:acetyl-CoA C-acetyltransferase
MTGKSTGSLSSLLARLAPSKERNLGLTIPALTAMMARKYMLEHDLQYEVLARVAVKNHYNASLNPNAHFQRQIGIDDVLSSRIISDPLRLYDCAPVSDGACAVVVTREKGPVRITGLGHEADTLCYQDRETISSFPASTKAALNALNMAGITRQHIDVVETHDAFTILELVNSEDLGFFERGKSARALEDGITEIGGTLPINPSGGLKAKGHPVGATGLAQVCEIFWQLTGEAGKRQVGNARSGLAHNIGGFGNNVVVTILQNS